MNIARVYHTSLPLSGGRVLILGGATASVEIFDVQSSTFSQVSPLSTVREWASVTLLPNGLVLVAGGEDPAVALNTAEVFDPATSTWSTVSGTMSSARSMHSATLLLDGRVLIAGGDNDSSQSLATAELYNPNSNSFDPLVGLMTAARRHHAATLLPDGRVLISGGSAGVSPVTRLDSACLFDPATNTFGRTGSMSAARNRHTATLLPDGTVLGVGGIAADQSFLATAEVYYPVPHSAPMALTFESGPGPQATVGQTLPAISVQLRDGTGAAVPQAGVGVMLSIITGVGAHLSGTLFAQTNAAGLATFSGVQVDTEGLCNIRASATLEGVISAEYGDISIELGTLTISPVTAGEAGHALAPEVQVTATRAEGGEMTGQVTLSVSGAPGLLLNGPITRTLDGGTASFDNVIVTLPGTAYSLHAGMAGAEPAESNAFDVSNYTAPLGNTVVFDVPPSRTTGGVSMSPVAAKVAFGWTPTPGALVTLSLASNPGGGTLSGTVTATTDQNGIARFNDLRIDRGGYGYTLAAASAPNVAAFGSTPFDVIGFSNGPVFGTGRVGFTMTRLNDGRILLAGGSATSGGPCLQTAELYDPQTGLISEFTMVRARRDHTATLLPDGSVLLVGGMCGGAALDTAERYITAIGGFEATGGMSAGRGYYTATLLLNGTVLVAGGFDSGSLPLDSAEVYAPASGSWTPTGSMPAPAGSATATIIRDGRGTDCRRLVDQRPFRQRLSVRSHSRELHFDSRTDAVRSVRA